MMGFHRRKTGGTGAVQVELVEVDRNGAVFWPAVGGTPHLDDATK